MRRTAVLLAALGMLFPAAVPAGAAIPGFRISSIEGIGELDGKLKDRLKDDFRVNYSDCLLYLGYDPLVSSGDESDGDVIWSYQDTSSPADTTGIDTASPDAAANDTVQAADTVTDTAGGADSKADDAGTPTPRFMIKWSLSPLQGYDYAVKVGACSESGTLVDEETDSCKYVVRKTSLSKYTNNELLLEVPDLLGASCEEGDVGESGLYFYVQYKDNTLTKAYQEVAFAWDYEAPAMPTELVLEEGENSLNVSWSDEVNNKDEVRYSVYWADKEFASISDEDVKSKKDVQTKSYRISGLQLGKTYYVGVVAVDEYDNASGVSELVSAVPVSVSDFWESYKDAGGGEDGGFCFVATVAMGHNMSGPLAVLRDYRDHVLLSGAFGRALVNLYYLNGHRLAAMITGHDTVTTLVAGSLFVASGFAWLSLRLGSFAALLLLFATGTALFLGIRGINGRLNRRRTCKNS